MAGHQLRPHQEPALRIGDREWGRVDHGVAGARVVPALLQPGGQLEEAAGRGGDYIRQEQRRLHLRRAVGFRVSHGNRGASLRAMLNVAGEQRDRRRDRVYRGAHEVVRRVRQRVLAGPTRARGHERVRAARHLPVALFVADATTEASAEAAAAAATQPTQSLAAAVAAAIRVARCGSGVCGQDTEGLL